MKTRKETPLESAPEGMTQEHFEFLDGLRERGETNMFGGSSFLISEMNVPRNVASKYLSHWMKTFEERQKENEI